MTGPKLTRRWLVWALGAAMVGAGRAEAGGAPRPGFVEKPWPPRAPGVVRPLGKPIVRGFVRRRSAAGPASRTHRRRVQHAEAWAERRAKAGRPFLARHGRADAFGRRAAGLGKRPPVVVVVRP